MCQMYVSYAYHGVKFDRLGTDIEIIVGPAPGPSRVLCNDLRRREGAVINKQWRSSIQLFYKDSSYADDI